MPRPQLRSGTAVVCLSAELPTADGLPSEFRIFPFGEIDTDRGRFLFDEESARQVVAASREWGVEHSIDYEHAAIAEPPVPAPAAGWFRLDVREDGLYAANVRWTDKAAAHLSAREYRYFSPVFAFEANDSKRITALFNVALTNTPAIRRLEPLMPASARPVIDSRSRARLVALKASFDEISTAVRAALIDHFGLSDADMPNVWVVEVYDDHAIFEKDSQLYRIGYTFDGASVTLVGEAVEVRRVYEPIVPESQPQTPATTVTPTEPQEEVEALSALTGRKSRVEALAVVRAWKQSAGEVEALSARVRELEQSIEKRERDALIAQGLADRKLTPALRAWAESQPVTALRAFLEAAPRVIAPPASAPREQAPTTGGAATASGKRWEDLKPIEKHRLAQSEPELYAALKADFESRKNIVA